MSFLHRLKQMLCDSTGRPADDPTSQEHQALLAEINADLPAGVDWTAGAQRYVMAEIAKYGREPYIRYLLAKPFALVHPGEGGRASRLEDAHYLYNFTNAFALLDLPGGSAVLDVACGSGWISHFFALMGYAAHGFDLCADMVDITRRRLHQDPGLAEVHPLLEDRFFQLDIERQKLPSTLAGTFGAIVLESCLHHFLDPITALSHLVGGLSSEGLVLVIEGEARTGPLNPAYVAVMREFSTLERPYTRDQLTRALRLAGLPHHRFLGRLNGWFTADDPTLAYLTERLRADVDALNLVICARTPEALRRVVPHYGG